MALEGKPETDENALAQILAQERNADRIIVASLGRFTEEARLLAVQRKVQLWDRAQLEGEVGRMVMGELDSRQAAADDSLLEPFLSGRAEELLPEAGAGGREQGAGGRVPGAGDEAGEAQADLGAAADMDIPEGEAMVRPALSLEQARGLVSERLEGAFRFDLQLMPHYFFSYSLEMEGPGGRKEKRSGGMLINAISGEARQWRPGGAPEKLEPGRIRMEPSIERAEAVRKAMIKVVALNTRVLNLRQEKRSVTVYEKRTLSPAEEAIKLELRGMLFLPVWCVEGANGAAVLDALTGRVIKEELFDARPAALQKGPGSGKETK